MSRIALLLFVIASLGAPALARAQSTGTITHEADTAAQGGASTTSTTSSSTSQTTSGSAGGASALGDEQAMLEEREGPPPQRSGFEPGEVHDETYIFAGVLARALIIPSFPFEIGGVDFPAGFNVPIEPIAGVYFNYRRNAFNVNLEVYYQNMAWEGFLRGSTDPTTETEFIRSDLALVLGYVGFGWAFDLADWFAIELGFGLGFGGTLGNLYRQEAYRDDATGTWSACVGPGTPATTLDYCENSVERVGPEGRLDDTRQRGGTYQLHGANPGATGPGTGPNPFYFGSGGVPPIFFTIDLPRLSFRIKPIHQLQIRIDTAFNGYGFSLGGSLGYGF